MNKDPLLHKVGRVVTRVMMRPAMRRSALGRRAYAWMYLTGKYLAEGAECRFFRSHLRPGMTVLDVGANVGFYTTLFSELVGPQGSIFAFEPDPFCYGILEERIRAKNLRNIRAFPLALGDLEGRASLYCNNVNRADNRLHASHRGVPVEVVEVFLSPFDAVAEREGIGRIDAVKMDIQGAEVAALRGMRKTIASCQPKWLFLEFSPADVQSAGTDPREFWSLLREMGYCAHRLEADGEPLLITDEEAFTREFADSYTNVYAVRSES